MKLFFVVRTTPRLTVQLDSIYAAKAKAITRRDDLRAAGGKAKAFETECSTDPENPCTEAKEVDA